MRRYIFCLLLFTTTVQLYSQNSATYDSLKFVLKKSVDDTNKVAILSDLATEVYLFNPQEAIQLAQEIIEVSKRIDFPHGIAVGYGWKAYLLNATGRNEEALQYNLLSVPLFIEQENYLELGITYNNIANIYLELGEISLACSYNYKGLELCQQIGDEIGIAHSLMSLGGIYYRQGKILKAIDCYKYSLFMSIKTKYKKGMAKCFHYLADLFYEYGFENEALNFYNRALSVNIEIQDKKKISSVYIDMGSVFEAKGQLNKALNYYSKAKDLSSEIDDKSGLGNALSNIGYIYFQKGNFKDAVRYELEAYDILSEAKMKSSIADCAFKLGKIYYDLNQLADSKYYLTIAYSTSVELGYPKNIKNSAGLLYKILKSEGQWQKALELHENYLIMKDSIENDDSHKFIMQQQFQFEMEKDRIVKLDLEKDRAEKEVLRLRRRNNVQYISIALILMVIFGIIVSAGFIKIPPRLFKAIIFISLLVFFEFILVLSDPYTDQITSGVPAYKLIVNTIFAFLIFPIHQLIERILKKRVSKSQ